MRRLLTHILLLIAFYSYGQDTLFLDERSFLHGVWTNSPYVKSRRIGIDLAHANLLEKRAEFQPKIQGLYEQKRFGNSLYYSRLNSGLELQTNLGIKVSSGLQKTDGIYLNPEANLPQSGLFATTVEIPLGAGLLTDKNRAAVNIARLGVSNAELQYWLDINRVLYEAGTAYWKWYESTYLNELAAEAVELTASRLDFVRAKQAIGEFASIDTLEASINLQSRKGFYNEQRVLLRQRAAETAKHLGRSNASDIIPTVDLSVHSIIIDSSWTAELLESHPVSRIFQINELQNDAQIRLAREFFKPKIDLKYGQIQDMGDPFILKL